MLPVEHILPELHQQLSRGDAIVVAPPGAGKSTCLPLSLLQLDAFNDKKIVLLQPRRLAVRNIARYLAEQLNEPVGQTVGYRIRGESQVSEATRLEIVTEGILTRMLQNHPEIPGVGLVIFDEFHERSVHADFSLALCLEVQEALRDDLRLVIMSATLDTEELTRLLPKAQLLESKGKSYPVELVYRPDNSSLPLHEKICRITIDVFAKHVRDILVFLPGAADINKAALTLSQHFGSDVKIHKLFSELSKTEQQEAIMPAPNGVRKVILATNIAETSLTIEGIEVVIDSGVEKQAVFQLNRGISHLQTQKISQASATQRAGRAGRLGPGYCYRLWAREQHERMPKQSMPEILHTDMSAFMLESAIWGTQVTDLSLIDYPKQAQLDQGSTSLTQLALFDEQHCLTPLGRKAHALGGQPSIAIMLLKSADMSTQHLSLACALATLFESKDPLSYDSGASVSSRLHYLLRQRKHPIWQTIRHWHKRMSCQLADWPFHDVAILIAFAYPQWLAKQRKNERYQLANGSGAILHRDDSLQENNWIAIAAMQTSDKQQDNAQIRYADPLSKQQLERHFGYLLCEKEKVEWDEKGQRISAYRQHMLGSIIIQKQPMEKPSPEQVSAIWRSVITTKGIEALPLCDKAMQLICRVRLASQIKKELALPDFSEEGLLNAIETWLLPYLADKLSWQKMEQCDFNQQLKSELTYLQQQAIDKFFPERISLPSGRNGQLHYSEHNKVTLSVRIQELYGLQQHPAVGQGHLAVTVELLSPAHRPIQTTQDLPGFWSGSYKEVQKEMKGRYPRHFWPDNPGHAQATTKTKKRMNVKS